MATVLADDELREILTRMASPLSEWEREKLIESVNDDPKGVAVLLAMVARYG